MGAVIKKLNIQVNSFSVMMGWSHGSGYQLSRIIENQIFAFAKTKAQISFAKNCEADQPLCFRYTDSTISLLPKSEVSSFLHSSVAAQDGLCRTWSETQRTGFLASRLN